MQATEGVSNVKVYISEGAATVEVIFSTTRVEEKPYLHGHFLEDALIMFLSYVHLIA